MNQIPPIVSIEGKEFIMQIRIMGPSTNSRTVIRNTEGIPRKGETVQIFESGEPEFRVRVMMITHIL